MKSWGLRFCDFFFGIWFRTRFWLCEGAPLAINLSGWVLLTPLIADRGPFVFSLGFIEFQFGLGTTVWLPFAWPILCILRSTRRFGSQLVFTVGCWFSALLSSFVLLCSVWILGIYALLLPFTGFAASHFAVHALDLQILHSLFFSCCVYQLLRLRLRRGANWEDREQ